MPLYIRKTLFGSCKYLCSYVVYVQQTHLLCIYQICIHFMLHNTRNFFSIPSSLGEKIPKKYFDPFSFNPVIFSLVNIRDIPLG